MWQNAENYPHYWWEHENNALSQRAAAQCARAAAGDKLLATAALPILYAFLTLIYVFFILYSPVTATLDCISLNRNLVAQ